MEINIWVGNVGRYNEGDLVGEWFTLPVEFEEVRKSIGLNAEYEEYMIFDYEAPFRISEYASLEELNEIAEKTANLSEIEFKAIAEVIDMNYTIEEALQFLEDGEIVFYYDCQTMEDVAYQIVEECGLLEQIPENLRYYFDYEAYGRDLSIDGTFQYLGEGVYVELRF